jgi:putative copper resistance protein D
MFWSVMSIASKVFYLAGMAAVVGSAFTHLLLLSSRLVVARPLAIYAIVASVIGLVGSLGFFMSQVGLINDAGLSGLLDWSMASLLLDTNLGTGSMYRGAGFMAAIIIWSIVLFDCRDERLSLANPIIILTLSIFAGGVFAWSTTLTGHVSTLPGGVRVLLAAHLLAALIWIGSLWPLRIACNSADVSSLVDAMERFGNIAVYFVAILVVAGLWLVSQLVNEPSELLTTIYGNVFLLKLAGVTGLLALAARHKFRLVPQLEQVHGRQRLRRSIDIEMVVALLVVTVTGILTTVIGPEMNH